MSHNRQTHLPSNKLNLNLQTPQTQTQRIEQISYVCIGYAKRKCMQIQANIYIYKYIYVSWVQPRYWDRIRLR